MVAKTLTPFGASQALVALEALDADPAALRNAGHQRRLEHTADRLALTPHDRVELYRSTAGIDLAALAGDRDRLRRAAATVLNEVAQAHGQTPRELQVILGKSLPEVVDRAEVRAKGMEGSGVVLGAAARESYNQVMGMVGQWPAKRALASMMERAQLRLMVGMDPRGNGCVHVQVKGPAGSGKSTFMGALPAICADLKMIGKNQIHRTSGANYSGVNEGDIDKNVSLHFGKAKDGVLVIDEIQSLNSRGSWGSLVYGAIVEKLTSPEFAKTLVTIGGYGRAVSKFMEMDEGNERRFPNIFEMSPLTPDELTHLFLTNAQREGWEIDTATAKAVAKYYRRIALGPNSGNGGLVENSMQSWERNVGERVLRELSYGDIEPAAARDAGKRFKPEDIKPIVGAYSPGALFGDDITEEKVIDYLGQGVIGQPAALAAVAKAVVVRRSQEARTAETQKPVFRLAFVGPSAAGKSLLASESARLWMTPEDVEAGRKPPVFRVSANTIESMRSYLAGAQPGHIGHDKDCPLLDWMKLNKGGVIVFEEVDKGPKDFMEVLMEIFDSGLYTNARGFEADFSNYGIILTSNYGNEVGLHRGDKVDEAKPALPEHKPGQVNALAASVTDKGIVVGGGTMQVSVVGEEGQGRIAVKANAKNVMVESAEIALTYLRTHAAELGLDAKQIAKTDFTLSYSPAATPKDGPSAGITMTTALLSLLSGKVVPSNIAMTGEIDLHGSVLPVGGIREKIFAASQKGVTKIILPAANKKDVDELPLALRDGLTIVLANTYADVYAAVFSDAARAEAQRPAFADAAVTRAVKDARLQDYMRAIWRPEYLGRLTGGKVIAFEMLREAELRQVIRVMLEREGNQQLAAHELKLRISPEMETHMLGFWDDDTGARPVVGALAPEIIAPLLRRAKADPEAFSPGSIVTADWHEGAVRFAVEAAPQGAWENVADWTGASKGLEKLVEPLPVREPAKEAGGPAPYPVACPDGINEWIHAALNPQNPTSVMMFTLEALVRNYTYSAADQLFVVQHMPVSVESSWRSFEAANAAIVATGQPAFAATDPDGKRSRLEIGYGVLHQVMTWKPNPGMTPESYDEFAKLAREKFAALREQPGSRAKVDLFHDRHTAAFERALAALNPGPPK